MRRRFVSPTRTAPRFRAALVVIALLTACQSQTAEAATCDVVDELFVAFFDTGDLDEYVALTQPLVEEAERSGDQVLRDVGTSLRVVALSWSEADFEDAQLYDANLRGVTLLTSRCADLRT